MLQCLTNVFKVCKQNLKPNLPTATRTLPAGEADDIRFDLKGKDGGGGSERNRTPKKKDGTPQKRETPKKNTCVLGLLS